MSLRRLYFSYIALFNADDLNIRSVSGIVRPGRWIFIETLDPPSIICPRIGERDSSRLFLMTVTTKQSIFLKYCPKCDGITSEFLFKPLTGAVPASSDENLQHARATARFAAPQRLVPLAPMEGLAITFRVKEHGPLFMRPAFS